MLLLCVFQVSEAIIEEEDEQVNVDRNIDEIDEQMYVHTHVNLKSLFLSCTFFTSLLCKLE